MFIEASDNKKNKLDINLHIWILICIISATSGNHTDDVEV